MSDKARPMPVKVYRKGESLVCFHWLNKDTSNLKLDERPLLCEFCKAMKESGGAVVPAD